MLGLREWEIRLRWTFNLAEAEEVARTLDSIGIGLELSGDHHPRARGAAQRRIRAHPNHTKNTIDARETT